MKSPAMLHALRLTLQSALRRHGIDVRKTPAVFEPIPVFNLAVEALMARRGDALQFVQVGANDGVFSDPLHPYITSRGWRGILVEPQADVFERLKVNYSEYSDRLVFENVAISDRDTLTLYLPPVDLGERDHARAYATVSSDASVLAKQIEMPEHRLRCVNVPALTLDALLARHHVTDLDLLQIDAEGYDWDILQTLDLARISPTLIQMETGHLHRTTLTRMAEHLNEADYLIYYCGQRDALAMKREFFASTT